ncbi:diguanylate cyclase domain-containing protein [Pseudoroseicyclus tamaricis]|uniref:diguanylate cyclase n=1 Tax=Pseudoroseicyclus tamaricis TaxID=2705421 RepID=A0A6B2K2D9_9RHOB|nr:diguanylate cyclase [Pseudoroseicyclus tamaricis]NDV01942.1 diguanylate cyclase [Pseudoroseicyclus tamaricis]
MAEGHHGGLRGWFRSLSLRTWLIVGMGVALLPIFIVGALTFATYHSQIAQPFREVLNTQHRILLPLERLQGEMWGLSAAVNDFAETGEEAYRSTFEATERQIATHLAQLELAAGSSPAFRPILDAALQDWALLVQVAAEVAPGTASSADPALLRFESLVAETGRALEALSETLRQQSEQSHAEALAAMRRLEIIAAVAVALTLLFTFLAIQIIDRALINSTDELVAGAMSITAGDRERQIDVQVPPELAAVASAFNKMTKQILEQERALSLAASTDSLTGLRNRRAFDRELAACLDIAEQSGQPGALLMIDVDNFKEFNDAHGHLAGDAALRQIGEALTGAAREGDLTFRYGGEEFAILVPNITPADALAAAERARAAVERQGVSLPTGEEQRMSVSIGVVTFGGHARGQEVVGRADVALYKAKAAGRNRVRLAGSGAGARGPRGAGEPAEA